MRALLLAFLVGVLATPAGAALKVVASTSDLASLATEIGGDDVKVDLICPGHRDPHEVELLPSYMLKLRRADVFLTVGMSLDLWAEALVVGARNRDLRVVDMSETISPLGVPTGPVSPADGDVHPEGNPHYWLDPYNAAHLAGRLASVFAEADPERAGAYAARKDAFLKELETRQSQWQAMSLPLKGEKIVFFHDSWPYFNRAFGLTALDFIEPKPGLDPSAAHLDRLAARMREEGVTVVAIAPFYPRKVAEALASRAGAEVAVLTTSTGGLDGVETWWDIFPTNLGALLAAKGEAH